MMEYYGRILAEAGDVAGDDRMWAIDRPEDIRHSRFGAAVMIGTPDQVARKLERFQRQFRCTHFIMSTQLARHGSAKGDALARALREGSDAGVSLGPRGDVQQASEVGIVAVHLPDEAVERVVCDCGAPARRRRMARAASPRARARGCARRRFPIETDSTGSLDRAAPIRRSRRARTATRCHSPPRFQLPCGHRRGYAACPLTTAS